MPTPLHMLMPHMSGPTHGSVEYHSHGDRYIVKAEPYVLEIAKRLFPGCATNQQHIAFKRTRRAVENLNWLMLRFPLKIGNAQRYMEDRHEALQHALSREAHATPPRLKMPAEFNGRLRPYQEESVGYLMVHKRGMCADEMGLGKTVSAIAGIVASRAWPALIVVQPHLQTQWMEKIHQFTEFETDDIFFRCKGQTPSKIRKVPFIICHYLLLQYWWEAILEAGTPLVAFDECQELRKTDSEKYKTACKITAETEYAWGLSGTPIYNYGEEVWAVYNALDHGCLGDRDSFQREWCTGEDNKIIEKPDVFGTYLRKEGLMIRHLKQDVQAYLPPALREIVTIDHDDSIYQKMMANAKGLARQLNAYLPPQERGRLKMQIEAETRRAVGVAKAPHVGMFVKGLIEAGQRPLLFAWHHDVYAILNRILADYHPAMITGLQTMKEKDAAKESFIRGHNGCLMLSLRGAAGIDGLQHAATCCIFAELDWSPAIHAQDEARLNRDGVEKRIEHVMNYYMVSRTGMDEVMQEALGVKSWQFKEIFGVGREVPNAEEHAKEVAERHIDRVIGLLQKGVI